MISNRFSWARTWALTRRYVVENQRYLLMAFGSIFGVVFLTSILITKAMEGDYEFDNDYERMIVLGAVYGWMAILGVQITGSLTFNALSTKAKRASAIMLPAAQSEKFLCQTGLYVISGNLVWLLIFAISDAVSALLFGMRPAVAMIPWEWMFSCGENVEMTLAIVLCALWFGLFCQAIYVIGSALWPKLSFLKTFVALFVLQTIIPIIVPFDFLENGFMGLIRMFEGWDLPETVVHIISWCLLGLFYVVLGGMYYIAWRIFKRTQIIQRFKTK